MLDFYLIHDNQTHLDFQKEEDIKFVGGLENETFENLQEMGVIEERFDYHTDFRWVLRLLRKYI